MLNYAISFAALFAFLIDLGINSVLVRQLVNSPDRRDELLGTSIVLKFSGWLVMFLMIIVSLFVVPGITGARKMVLIISAGYLFQVFQTIDYYFQSKVQSKYVALSQMAAWIIVSACRAYFAFAGVPVLYFAILESANMILTGLGFALFYGYTTGSIFKWRFHWQTAKSLMHECWPLLLSSATVMIYMRIDQVMIKSMISPEANGQYAIAIKLCEMWYILPMIIGSSMFPALVRAKKVSIEHYWHRLKIFSTIMIWTGIFIALFMTVFGGILVSFIYGSAYDQAGKIITIYSWVGVLVFYGAIRSKWLVNENLTKYALIATSCVCVVNIVANIFFIRKLGVNGAAVATLTAYYAYDLTIMPFIKKVRPIWKLFFTSLIPVYLIKKSDMS